ncbi:MAG: hypothetical protein HRU38_23000 [Saccharospirillaceae bacterium]|nr:hypothetical protein [Pseudomonadales bacterium]NRB81492.1 hypothetical protein [Saccharospirillaceae bacterium]
MLTRLVKTTQIDQVDINGQIINIIRLDQNDPFVCGNKWLKLSLNITEESNRYATFGGPHSNHLHAFSYACKQLNKQHVVFVRGIGPKDTPTLLDIQKNNGLIVRLSKKDYAKKQQQLMQQRWKNIYGEMSFIPEGGNNQNAVNACASWYRSLNLPENAIVAVSIGTGCTFTGIANALHKHTTLVGLPAFYMHEQMQSELLESTSLGELHILNAQKQERFAKMDLIQWNQMLAFEAKTQILLDPVYTGKTLFRFIKHYQDTCNRPLYFIHTGGLQGRRVYQQQYS